MLDTEAECEMRILRPSDAAAYGALRLESLQQAPKAFETAYEDMTNATDEDSLAFLSANLGIGYFEGSRLVGMVFHARHPGSNASHRSSIFNFYVTRDYQGSGVARNLIRVIEMHSKTAGIAQLELYVSSGAERAISFYKRLGFENTGKIPNAIIHEGKGYDFLLMVLTLDTSDTGIQSG